MATRINLLDHRAVRRERRKKEFFAFLGVAVAIAAAVVGIAELTVSAEIENQDQRNLLLTQQIAEMDKKSKEIEQLEKVKASLLARMRVIENLQQSRSGTVHFFDEIINTLPDGVYVTDIKQVADSVTVDGIAESNGRVSTYLKNIDASPWFSDPQLVIIRTDEKNKQRNSQFTITFKNLTQTTGAKTAGNAPSQGGAGK